MIASDAPLQLASLIVHCLPAAQQPLRLLIESQPGAEVGAQAEGKLVVLLEARHGHQIMDFIDRIQLEAGVLAANLVYHCEDADETAAEPTPQGVHYETP